MPRPKKRAKISQRKRAEFEENANFDVNVEKYTMFQTQTKLLCGFHAINNALQKDVLTIEIMKKAWELKRDDLELNHPDAEKYWFSFYHYIFHI